MRMDFDFYGGIAQLGEHLPCKQGVMSSILIISTMAFKKAENTSWHNNENWYNRNSAVSVETQTTARFVPWELNNVIQRMRFKREFEIRFKKMRRQEIYINYVFSEKVIRVTCEEGEILWNT